ncbi:hypothetical protein EH206_20355 [Brenneria nigrifluens DSM 30175 = ATCC 13028]|uniref:Transcriptional regulator n=1 Tax=Brenneria nigrifluens DSM 30175 = ATCC 13028 TaxID=1121120 RepID=A0A2U1UIW9_9GAMM|nr:hypothetical protein DDT54_18530 [Brenneria nigrifluens DSM 30175 = ATCC 13028]QCR07045.1 hypothetical protein EH206_20355 [Brenneria nigrifluens DSM 30175 = ATCC 13028]
MQSFDTQVAMAIISRSTGGFSYDTLARALISNVNYPYSQHFLDECRSFCLQLEEKGLLRRCPHCVNVRDEYFEYVHH